MEKQPCEYAGGTCYEMPDVGCDYHGEEALKNKTGYYATMPNKEPTKEWREDFGELLFTLGQKYRTRVAADTNSYHPHFWVHRDIISELESFISQAIKEAIESREAELIEKLQKVIDEIGK